ncbi:substrate-binding domain-containing protein [Arthrobacter bambusae]|uniref:substrate-binding domain-containing protein n=1 Tax=Arthrobacter bambusae TaxID=1338426 RepID=UPI003557414F|nr:substrate-binding domain-containing protein [Arthrobacter bambusae]
MNELITYRGRPTTMVAGCNEIAFGSLKALEEHGLRTSENLSIVGIDDHTISSQLHLSTVAQPVKDQAALWPASWWTGSRGCLPFRVAMRCRPGSFRDRHPGGHGPPMVLWSVFQPS